MFEKEIKFIVDFNLNKVKKLGSFFTFEKLLETDLHPSIKLYISTELDYLIYLDRKKLLENSAFDYSGPAIEKYFKLISKEIQKTKKVSFEDVKKIILQAVSFNANFVIRPNWALSKLIFNDAEIKEVSEVSLYFDYIYYYDYLKEIFNNYIAKRNITSITMMEFEVILNKIDKALFTSHTKDLINNALYLMADFYGQGSQSKDTVSVNWVEMFLKEKNLIDYIFRLRKALPPDAKPNYSINEIKNVLFTSSPIEKQTILPSVDEVKQAAPESFKTDETEHEEKTLDQFIPAEEPEEENEIDQVNQKTDSENFQSGELENINETDTDIANQAVKENSGSTEDLFSELQEDRQDEISDDLILEKFEAELSKLENGNLVEDDSKVENKSGVDDITESEVKATELLDEYKKNNESILEATSAKEENVMEFTEDETRPVDKSSASEDELLTENFPDGDIPTEMQQDSNTDFNPEEENINEQSSTTQFSKPKFGKDLFSFLSDRDIDKIVSVVFNDDREDFANTVEKINECSSFEEATEIIKGVFLSYRVNPYTKEAIVFTNAVSNYFDQV